ncbi:MAG: class A beta-lactamase [Candidatus Zhuqueibacterota bacterium]
MNRRTFLQTAATIPLAFTAIAKAFDGAQVVSPQARLAQIEKTSTGRLGVFGVNTENGARISHRADERFPMCSTFKAILAAAILARSVEIEGLLQRRIRYEQGDLVTYSPITEKHIGDGMTISELCAAAIQYSDNTAANLLMKVLGGPVAVTAYTRSIGNSEFRLDRWETELNTCIPGDLRDTATPASMALSLRSLTLGDALPPGQAKQLTDWLRGNTTGAKRIRAAMPAEWHIGDKTGSGDYGTANDIAVIYPPERKPIVLAIYHTQEVKDVQWRDDIIKAAAQIVVDDFLMTKGTN